MKCLNACLNGNRNGQNTRGQIPKDNPQIALLVRVEYLRQAEVSHVPVLPRDRENVIHFQEVMYLAHRATVHRATVHRDMVHRDMVHRDMAHRDLGHAGVLTNVPGKSGVARGVRIAVIPAAEVSPGITDPVETIGDQNATEFEKARDHFRTCIREAIETIFEAAVIREKFDHESTREKDLSFIRIQAIGEIGNFPKAGRIREWDRKMVAGHRRRVLDRGTTRVAQNHVPVHVDPLRVDLGKGTAARKTIFC